MIELQTTGLANSLLLLLGAAALDVLSGLVAAWMGGTLSRDFIAEFLRSHVLFRITPIFGLLLVGTFLPDPQGELVRTAGAIGALAYAAEITKSVVDNLGHASSRAPHVPTADIPVVIHTEGTIQPPPQ